MYTYHSENVLKNRLVRSTSCLSPKIMLEPAQLSTNRLDKVLEIPVGLKKVTSEMKVKVKQEYSKFLTHVVKPNTKTFNEFEESKNRLESFL